MRIFARQKKQQMGLHRKSYYQKRRQYIKEPFEVQEKGVRRIDHVFYVVIALPTLYALVHECFVSNFGRAVFFALFFIWWTCFCFKPEIHRLAKKKGWNAIAKMTYDKKKEKPREEAALRKERLNNPIDTETLILVEKATELEELEILLFDYVKAECDNLSENLPLLWKVGEYCYAITFPCGISRQHLHNLTDNLVCFLPPETIHAWCRPRLFKKNKDGWLYICNGDDDLLDALSDDGTAWDIDYDDAMLHNPHSASGYKEYPNINWNAAEQIGLYF